MRQVGVQPEDVFHRQPLALTFADGTGLRLPDLAPPWDALAGIGRRARLALAQGRAAAPRPPPGAWAAFAARRRPPWPSCAWDYPGGWWTSSSTRCAFRRSIPRRTEASGQVFLRVLQDNLFSGRGRLASAAAAHRPGQRLRRTRGTLAGGSRRPRAHRRARAAHRPPGRHLAGGRHTYDAVVLATPAPKPCACCARWPNPCCSPGWPRPSAALIPITTVSRCRVPQAGAGRPHAGAACAGRTSRRSSSSIGGSSAALPGCWPLSSSTFDGERAPLEAQVLARARACWGWQRCIPCKPWWKSATFACTPALQRPPSALLPGLWATGDYIDGPTPPRSKARCVAAAPWRRRSCRLPPVTPRRH